MLNELKMLTKGIYAKILISVVIIVSIAVSVECIKTFHVVKSGKFNNEEGRAAISLIKERYENSKGILTTDKLNKALKYYHSIPNSDTAYVETSIKYPGMLELINSAYVSDYRKEKVTLHNLNNTNDFYTRNVEIISKNLNDSENTYKPWEKDIILEKAKTIDKPFAMDFSKQWVFVYQCLMACFVIIAVSAIIMGSRLFSYEDNKNKDILLDSLKNSSPGKIFRNKIGALFTFLTGEILIGVIIISLIIFSNTGISSLNSQIQLEYFTSIYHLTFGQGYLLVIFTGWISILAIGMFTATLSTFIQKYYTTLTIGVILTFIPMIAATLNVFPAIITKFFKMQPINACCILGNLQSLQIYNFLFSHTLTITAIIINSIIILVICAFIAPRLFSAKVRGNVLRKDIRE